jgi:hypothetical protein
MQSWQSSTIEITLFKVADFTSGHFLVVIDRGGSWAWELSDWESWGCRCIREALEGLLLGNQG